MLGSRKGATGAITALAVAAPFYTHEMSHRDGEGLAQGHSRSKWQVSLPHWVCRPCRATSVFGRKKEVRETY